MICTGTRVVHKDGTIGYIESFCMELGMRGKEFNCYYIRWENGNVGIVDEDKLFVPNNEQEVQECDATKVK